MKRIARYKQIENDLLSQINTHYYNVGDMIPTELELSQRYKVSRVTVRKATDNLVAKNYLKRIAGSGTYVQNNAVDHELTSLIGFTEQMKKRGLNPETKVKSFNITKADKKIAQLLRIEEGERVYYFERIRLVEDKAYILERTYMSVEMFPDLSIEHLEGSKYHYVEKIKDYKIDYAHHQIMPVIPSEEIEEIMHLETDMPVLKIVNTTYLTNGKIMDYTVQIINSPIYQYNYIHKRAHE